MIYVDSSVVLAYALAETRVPPDTFWEQTLVSSRLITYESWVTLNRRRVSRATAEVAQQLLNNIAVLELLPEILERALDPFPSQIRTLDALHLASAAYLVAQRVEVEVATYDARFARAAKSLGLTVRKL